MSTRTPGGSALFPSGQDAQKYHSYWGTYPSAAELPNGTGNVLSGLQFTLQAGDIAYVPDFGTYTCTSAGSAGGGDATWFPTSGVTGILLFRPGGAPNPVVLTTWPTLMLHVAPLAALGVPFLVVFDLTLVGGTFTPPAGTFAFGGLCTFSGSGNAAPGTLVFDTGTFITGVQAVEGALTLTTIGTTAPLVIPNNGMLTLTDAILDAQTAPLIEFALGVLTLRLETGSAIQNSGSSCVKLDPGATGLVITGLDDAVVGSDTIEGVAGTLALQQRSLGATLAVGQALFTGTTVYQAIVSEVFASFGAFDLPLVAGVYWLSLNGGGFTATATRTDWVPPPSPTSRIAVLAAVTLAQNAGGVVGPGYTIEVLAGPTAVFSFTVPNPAMPNPLRFPLPVSSGGQPLNSNAIGVRVTVPPGMTASPTSIYVGLSGF